jgi:hypothetical protein
MNDGKTTEECKEYFEERVNIDYFIPYVAYGQFTMNGDGFAKNWQWTTWDGEYWTANPYDLDGLYGAYFMGNLISTPNTIQWLNNLTTDDDTGINPASFVFKYYKSDIRTAYAKYRDNGIFSTSNVIKLVSDWVNAIGEHNFELEFKKWNETPCYRDSYINSTYWKLYKKSPSIT